MYEVQVLREEEEKEEVDEEVKFDDSQLLEMCLKERERHQVVLREWTSQHAQEGGVENSHRLLLNSNVQYDQWLMQ